MNSTKRIIKWSFYQYGKYSIFFSSKIIKHRIGNQIQLVGPWFSERIIFFLLGIGRSGSLFLTELLNKSENVITYHEPVRLDFFAYLQAYFDEFDAENYINSFRQYEIFYRNKHITEMIYGEVNSILRRHAPAIKTIIPSVKLIHLIRDGRDVVRSMMSRRTFTIKDPITSSIHPKEDSPWFERWKIMSRFEKLCWYWSIENQYLRKEINKTVHFEKLISDYTYFEENLAGNLNIEIPKNVWVDSIYKPKNITHYYKIPHWRDWSYPMKKTFEVICGGEMDKNGYTLKWQ